MNIKHNVLDIAKSRGENRRNILKLHSLPNLDVISFTKNLSRGNI